MRAAAASNGMRRGQAFGMYSTCSVRDGPTRIVATRAALNPSEIQAVIAAARDRCPA